ncbi:MAG: hypothetical protein EZS28_009504 [Streblomastix strix]|uniref:Uncharacterized protein n=1 Tax=Streblomastix strix TaxID=222440 RepID=A0A5J4WKY8_9EUKA|nr:MAG: hypothetical protein EZS28_009504 [Streblomastix strix]
MLLLFALALVSIGQSFSFGNLFQFSRSKPITVGIPLAEQVSLRFGNETSIDRFDSSANAELVTCNSNGHSFPCLCSGDGQDPPNCYCTEFSFPTTCTPQLCTSSEQTYPCFCTTDPRKDTNGCLCSGSPNQPSNCKYPICVSNQQTYPCLCTGSTVKDPTGCVCTAEIQLVHHCKLLDCASSDNNSKPCLCTGKDGRDPEGCICSGKVKAESYCEQKLCQYNNVLYPGKCQCDIINHPEGCTPVACEDTEQDYPCICTGSPSVDKEGCICTIFDWDNYLPLPAGCTLIECESVNQNEPCLCTGKTTKDPQNCFCSGNEKSGQQCVPQDCTSSDQSYPCNCTGNAEKDTPFCVCSSDNHPELCTCQDENDSNCICSDNWLNPSECIRLCKVGEFPEGGINPGVFNCVCPEGDVTCLAGPQQCDGGGTYTQPTPPGCKPKPCDGQNHICQCTGYESIDEVNCFCSDYNADLSLCTPRICESSGQNYPCLCSGNPNFDPYNCSCNNVGEEDIDWYYTCLVIDCKDPDIMYPGKCGCTQANHPLGCEPTSNCHYPNQGYPCFCDVNNLERNTPDCFCGGYPGDPFFCLCPYSHYSGICLCNDIIENDNCVPTCQDGQFTDYDSDLFEDNCICDSKDQTCLDGPNPCTDENYDPEYPYACKIISCSDKTKNSPCLCTGNEDLDTEDCICKEGIGDNVEPGSCYCDPSLEPSRTPLGCKCKEKGDGYCVCSDRENDPYNCYTICQDGELPEEPPQFPNPGCLCRFDDDECLSGTYICKSTDYIHPYPDNCYPQPCSSSLQQTTCICSEETSLNPDHCRDHLCIEGEFPGSDNCMCDHDDVTCYAGRKPCSEGSYDEPSPSGCYPVLCELNNQDLPCICTGHQNRDRPDCVCIGQKEGSGLCKPAFCGAGGGGDCICGGEDKSNPPGCICDGNDAQPDDCRPAIPTTEYDGSCTGGTNIEPYPPSCEIKECESSEQTAPCICTSTIKDTDDCMCSAATGASVEQRSCICGLGHHPTGCICSSSSDSGCICSSTLATNPSGCTSLDCTADSGTTVTQDSCVCTKNNHPTGCKPAECTGINDYEQCLCSGVENEPGTCTLDVCKSSSYQYPCICTGTNIDTPTCICSQGDADTVTTPGSCVCGINHHPTGCICSSGTDENCLCSDTSNPQADDHACICTLDNDPTGCICSQGDAGTVTPQGSCTCSINHHPAGCICQSQSDSGCICSSISANNPTGCICSTSLPSNPSSCTIQECKVDSEITVTQDSCICTGTNHPNGCKPVECTGINDYSLCLCSGIENEPGTCILDVCQSSDQQYPCICTEDTEKNPPGCICSQRDVDTVTPGSCTCGLGHHPTGCNCSSQTDSKCICTINLEMNPLCTWLDCTADSDPFLEETCTCTKEYHQKSCSCPSDSADLVGIPYDACLCRKTGDPRVGGICPYYCISKDIPNYHCVCDNESTTYNKDQCLDDRKCKIDYDITIPTESCVCTETYHPKGCYCEDDSDTDCICSSVLLYNPSGCFCSTFDQNPPSCIIQDCEVDSEITVTQDSCYCTETNHPNGCKPVACQTTVLEYACLCDSTNHPSGCTPDMTILLIVFVHMHGYYYALLSHTSGVQPEG